MMEWVAISFSRASSQPRDWTLVSCIAGEFFTDSATREALFVQKKKNVKDIDLKQQLFICYGFEIKYGLGLAGWFFYWSC